MVTPGKRLSTSPKVASPCFSISSRPMTIFAAVDSRRVSVSLLRLLRISMRPKSVAGAVWAIDKAGTHTPPAASKCPIKGLRGEINAARPGLEKGEVLKSRMGAILTALGPCDLKPG
jgi:hypothetical protein